MDFIVVLTYISQASDAAQKIHTLIKGGQLSCILEAIGDIEFENALKVLARAKRSSNVRDELHTAKTLMLDAYGKIIPRRSWLQETINPIRLSRRYEKASATATAIALCYKKLGDRTPASDYLEEAVDHFEQAESTYPTPNAQPGSALPPDYYLKESLFKEKREKLKKTCQKISPSFRSEYFTRERKYFNSYRT